MMTESTKHKSALTLQEAQELYLGLSDLIPAYALSARHHESSTTLIHTIELANTGCRAERQSWVCVPCLPPNSCASSGKQDLILEGGVLRLLRVSRRSNFQTLSVWTS
jgi:hypothetical protein